MASSYTELRYFRSQDQRIETLYPDLARQICFQHDLQVPDPAGDRLLFALCEKDDRGAFLCLRCHVSNALNKKVEGMVRRFSSVHLRLYEVAGFVLHDDGDRRRREPLSFVALRQQLEEAQQLRRQAKEKKEWIDPILPFAAQVICSYDASSGAGMESWAGHLLNSYPPLKSFLRTSYGIILITDWALLKDTSGSLLQRAWPFLPAPILNQQRHLSLDHALNLHANYCREYDQDRREYRHRYGRSGGYQPSSDFLRKIHPDARPAETLEVLRGLATAIRRYKNPDWQRQLSLAPSRDEGDTLPDPIETLMDPASLTVADDASDSLLQQIHRALQRALDKIMPAVIAPTADDPQLLCLWRGFVEALNTKDNAKRCGCSGPVASRKLQSETHASTVAREAVNELKRLSAFEAVNTSSEVAERVQAEFKKRLLAKPPWPPEQEGDESLPTLRQWVQRHLPSS